MLSNADVQAGLIEYLKEQSELTFFLGGLSTEIRETQWQGRDFIYPAYRVRLGTQYPLSTCSASRITFGVQSFSEEASSRECDQMAGEANDVLHNKSFTRNGIRYMVYSTGLVSAIRRDDNTWRSEALFKAIVEPAI